MMMNPPLSPFLTKVTGDEEKKHISMVAWES